MAPPLILKSKNLFSEVSRKSDFWFSLEWPFYVKLGCEGTLLAPTSFHIFPMSGVVANKPHGSKHCTLSKCEHLTLFSFNCGTNQWRSQYRGKGGRVPSLTAKKLPKIWKNQEQEGENQEKIGKNKEQGGSRTTSLACFRDHILLQSLSYLIDLKIHQSMWIH